MLKLCKNFLIQINFDAVDDVDLALKQFEIRNKIENSENIHVIIMDFNMNKMDGNIAT